jgi:hypothetical protein
MQDCIAKNGWFCLLFNNGLLKKPGRARRSVAVSRILFHRSYPVVLSFILDHGSLRASCSLPSGIGRAALMPYKTTAPVYMALQPMRFTPA